MLIRDTPAPGAKAWFMWGLTIIFLLFQFILQGSVSAMAPFLAKDFHTDVAAVGWVSSSYFWTYLLLQVPGGALVDRIGAKRLLIVGTIFCAVGTLLFSTTTSIEGAVWARLLTGLGTAPALACCFYLVGNWFSPAYFAFVVGLSEALAMIAGGVGAEIISTATILIGWRWVLIVAGILCLGMTLAITLFLRDRPKHINKPPAAAGLSIRRQFIKLFSLKQVWLCGLFSGLMFPIISTLATYWCIPYLMTRYGVGVRIAALGSLSLFLGAGFGCPFLGHLSDFFHQRKVMMAVGAVVSFLTLSLALYIPYLHFAVVVALFFLSGLFASVYMLPFALVNEIVPEEVRGTAMGFTNMLCILLGAPVLTPIVSLLLKKSAAVQGTLHFSTASYTLALSVLPLSFLFALIVLFWIHDPRRKK